VLKQRFLVQFGSKAITYVVGMLAGIIVARVAGPTVTGTLAYATAYVNIFAFVNGLFGSAHIKLASEGRDHASCMGVMRRLVIVSKFIYLMATAAMFLIQKYILDHAFESREVQVVIILVLSAHFLLMFEGYAYTVNTAKLKQAKANLPGFIHKILYHLGRIVLVLVGLRAIAISAWNLLATILILPIVFKMLKGYNIGKYDSQLAKQYFKFSVPMLVIVVINSVTHYADKLLLAHFTNTTELGFFTAANSVGGMLLVIAMPVGMVFFPVFSGMIAKGNWQGVNNNVNKYHQFVSLFIFPLVCTLAVAGGPPLLLVLGQRYQPSINPFIVLLFATYVVLWGMPYGNILSGMGLFNLSAVINVFKLITFIVAITLFVSPNMLNLGATGVALNLLAINLVVNWLYLHFAKKHGEIKINSRNYLCHLFIIALNLAGFFAAGALKRRISWWWILYIPISLIISYSFLIVSGFLKKENWRLLLDALNFKRTLKYVNGEIREE
jgi:O-antigen/teichoic acid export membrane protein